MNLYESRVATRLGEMGGGRIIYIRRARRTMGTDELREQVQSL